ncbi:hypothetical protein BGW80DRAFT_1266958 [Lactifluus volemus]|nr:hypothetical protein BGW80DRAFT_1266958 [Lactifluus volemus]
MREHHRHWRFWKMANQAYRRLVCVRPKPWVRDKSHGGHHFGHRPSSREIVRQCGILGEPAWGTGVLRSYHRYFRYQCNVAVLP